MFCSKKERFSVVKNCSANAEYASDSIRGIELALDYSYQGDIDM